MTYFLVSEGAIRETFDSPGLAARRAAERDDGSTVVGDEWLAYAATRQRVAEARVMLDELAPLLDPQTVGRKRAQLVALGDTLDAALGRLGLN